MATKKIVSRQEFTFRLRFYVLSHGVIRFVPELKLIAAVEVSFWKTNILDVAIAKKGSHHLRGYEKLGQKIYILMWHFI